MKKIGIIVCVIVAVFAVSQFSGSWNSTAELQYPDPISPRS